ncbi:MAG TPA: hypothetical protein VHO48_08225, partial [Anaerolineaceae bacterium]|nr:hypothetical protein [Anaerolineaceae bacterium]
MDFRKLTRETMLYAAAFGLALFLRLLLLGYAPLNDGEAGWALQALGLVHEHGALIGPQAGYITWTGALFDFFGSSNFVARLLPALAGSALTLAPLLLRRTIGRKPALVLAFALALDAGLLSISRQADGTMLAIGAAGFALAAWVDRR